MQPIKENFFGSIADIMIDIYLIGYSTQGESAIFLLYANDPQYKVIYSIAIDCYEENINATKELLDNILVAELDMLVWTHPHDDHSKGIIELIDQYCSKDTKIVLSNILMNDGMEMSEVCNEIRQKISRMNVRLRNKYDINDMVHFGENLKRMTFYNADSVSRLEIQCIAPISSINAKQVTKKEINLNDICVAIVIEVFLKNGKKMNFLFAGDIENEVLSELSFLQEDNEIPSTYNFIKIPHHGGRSAENMKKILNNISKSEYAASTIYRKSIEDEVGTNPDVELLKEYKNYIDNIGCTSDIINKKYGFGLLRINYSLSKLLCTIDTFGSAVEKVI